MARKLQIAGPDGINFNTKYEKLDKADRPSVEAKAPDGSIVKETTVYNGQVLLPGSTQRKWCDANGNQYQKGQLKFFYEGEEVSEIEATSVFQIDGFQPLGNYTDVYVIGKFYELYPSTNDIKKDFDKEKARIVNLTGMKKLFDKLKSENVVARGEFNASSKGFVAGDAYIRAVNFGNKWGLELGVFKEEKIFEHLQEEVPEIPKQSASPTKRLKRV